MKKAQKLLSNILKECSEFETKVYREVLSIPLGELRTYKQIAKNIAYPKAYRAVGQALKKNPHPFIIPCHRVVNSKGMVAQNFAFGGAISQKQLLEKEGVTFKRNKVDLVAHQVLF